MEFNPLRTLDPEYYGSMIPPRGRYYTKTNKQHQYNEICLFSRKYNLLGKQFLNNLTR